MIKIIVLSDSHGNKKKLEEILKTIKYDYVFFLGDGLNDIKNFNDTNIKKVTGNCDFYNSEAITQFVILESNKIMLTHGHDFKTKFTKNLILEYAKQNFCDIVCSGHTHKQGVEELDGIMFLNPGAFVKGQFAILKLEKNSKPVVEFFNT